VAGIPGADMLTVLLLASLDDLRDVSVDADVDVLRDLVIWGLKIVVVCFVKRRVEGRIELFFLFRISRFESS